MLLSTEKALFDDRSDDESLVNSRTSETSRRECPRCDSQSIARSRIRGMFGQFARRVFNLRPYRCLDCWHRFVDVSRHG